MPTVTWVIAEQDSRGLRDCTVEALGEARVLADGLAGRVCVALLGPDTSILTEIVKQQDVDAIYEFDHPLLIPSRPDAWVSTLASFFSHQQPGLVITSATAFGRELAPRLAARLDAPIVSGCIWIKPGPTRDIRLIRPSHAGQYQTTYSYEPEKWLIASLQPGVVGTSAPVRCRRPEIIPMKAELPDERKLVAQIEFIPGDPSSITLSEAERIVSGGRGVSDAKSWRIIEDAAEALDAAVGGSRLAMDLGYVPRSRMIGQTGIQVKPRLYLAAGISGADQHLSGIQAEHLIAINMDRNASIFRKATLGVIGDLHKILPKLTEKIQELKDTRKGRGA